MHSFQAAAVNSTLLSSSIESHIEINLEIVYSYCLLLALIQDVMCMCKSVSCTPGCVTDVHNLLLPTQGRIHQIEYAMEAVKQVRRHTHKHTLLSGHGEVEHPPHLGSSSFHWGILRSLIMVAVICKSYVHVQWW